MKRKSCANAIDNDTELQSVLSAHQLLPLITVSIISILHIFFLQPKGYNELLSTVQVFIIGISEMIVSAVYLSTNIFSSKLTALNV